MSACRNSLGIWCKQELGTDGWLPASVTSVKITKLCSTDDVSAQNALKLFSECSLNVLKVCSELVSFKMIVASK